jgi:hypothetical protein
LALQFYSETYLYAPGCSESHFCVTHEVNWKR